MKKKLKSIIISIVIIIFSGIMILLILSEIPVGTFVISLDLSTGEEVIEKNYLGGLIKNKRLKKTIITENWTEKVDSLINKDFYPISKSVIYIGSNKFISLKSGRRYYDLLNKCLENPDSSRNEIEIFLNQISNQEKNDLVTESN